MKGKCKDMKWLLILLGLMLANPLLRAQSDDGRALLYFISKDSVDQELLGYFYRTQGPFFHDPAVPKFMVASRNRNIVMGLGGYIMLRAAYDFDGTSTGKDFQIVDIPVPNAGNPRSQFQMDASSTRLFTKIIANTEKLGQIVGYIEGDFLGTGRAFRLRHAYVSLLGFTIGQATSTYIDPGSRTPHIDQNGSISTTYQRTPLIQYAHDFKNGLGLGVAIQLPTYSGTYSTLNASASASVPDFPLYVQYKWGSGHIRMTGLFRDMTYKDLQTSSYKGVFGVAGKLSGKIQLFKPFGFYYHAAYGKGFASFMTDLNGKGYDILSDPNSGKMFALKALSLYAAVRYDISPWVYGTAIWGYVRLYPGQDYRDVSTFTGTDFYRYGQYASGNILWNCFPSAVVGIEYCWGKRTNFDHLSGHANRVYGMMRYNF